MMRKRITTATLVLLLVLAACSPSKFDRAIAAVDAAALLPAALKLSEDEQRCASELFKGVSVALREMREHPSYKAWGAVTAAVQKFDSAACIRSARLAAIVEVLKRMVGVAAPSVQSAPTSGGIDEADLKELERLTGKRK